MARRNRPTIASSLSGSNWKIWLRDRSGELTVKNGFSVVAPSRMTSPSSTSLSRTSCWARLKRLDLVDEQDGALAGGFQPVAGGGQKTTHLPDAHRGGVDFLEVGLGHPGDDVGQRGLSRSGRAVEDGAGQPVGFEHATQEFARPDEVVLANELVEARRPHPYSQGRGTATVLAPLLGEQIHTSASWATRSQYRL